MQASVFWNPWLTVIAAAIAVATPGAATAKDQDTPGYFFIQMGPTFGIVNDSFQGDYEDTIGMNGRVGVKVGTFGDEVDFLARAGVGVQFPVTRHFYGFLEGAWNGGTEKLDPYSYLSLTTGIGFRF